MDGPSRDLLASPALAEKQNIAIRRGDSRDQLPYVLDGPTTADDAPRLVEIHYLALERFVVPGKRQLLAESAHSEDQVIEQEGLAQIVTGAKLHGLDCSLDFAVGRHHDEAQVRSLLSGSPEQVQAVHARQHQIRKYQIETVLLDLVKPVLGAGSVDNPVTLVCQYLAQLHQRKQKHIDYLNDRKKRYLENMKMDKIRKLMYDLQEMDNRTTYRTIVENLNRYERQKHDSPPPKPSYRMTEAELLEWEEQMKEWRRSRVTLEHIIRVAQRGMKRVKQPREAFVSVVKRDYSIAFVPSNRKADRLLTQVMRDQREFSIHDLILSQAGITNGMVEELEHTIQALGKRVKVVETFNWRRFLARKTRRFRRAYLPLDSLKEEYRDEYQRLANAVAHALPD